MNVDSLGRRIHARRKELKLTQRATAKLAGVAHVTISQWERDETQPVGYRLFSLAKVLSCSPDWLISGEESLRPPSTKDSPPALDPAVKHKELIILFDSLPESEQDALLMEMRVLTQNYDKLFNELVEARKRSQKHNER